MLFAKKRQRAVLRLVELPAAGYFLRAPQEKKEGSGQISNEAKVPLSPYSLLKLYKARRKRFEKVPLFKPILAYNEATLAFFNFLNFFAIFLEFSITHRVRIERKHNFYFHSRSEERRVGKECSS